MEHYFKWRQICWRAAMHGWTSPHASALASGAHSERSHHKWAHFITQEGHRHTHSLPRAWAERQRRDFERKNESQYQLWAAASDDAPGRNSKRKIGPQRSTLRGPRQLQSELKNIPHPRNVFCCAKSNETISKIRLRLICLHYFLTLVAMVRWSKDRHGMWKHLIRKSKFHYESLIMTHQ